MGKYMRRRNLKSKTSREVSLMEAPSLVGVLTRAKALALQKYAAAVSSAAPGSYIQLRSRRLVKPNSPKKQRESCVPTNPNKLRVLNSSTLKVDSVNSAVSARNLAGKEEEIRRKIETESKGAVNLVAGDEEGPFGENTLEIEGRGRTTRETTPCSLIRDPDNIKTPGSSTKSTTKLTRPTETKYGVLNTTPKPIPSTSEVDEFFMGPEMQQQQLFIEKYNFDPVNDKPLHGRYEWVKLDATKKS